MLSKKEIMLTRIERSRRIIKLMEEIVDEDWKSPVSLGIQSTLTLLKATINQLETDINHIE